jgi:CspA family cold shock protein
MHTRRVRNLQPNDARTAAVEYGIIKRWFSDRGFGFITPDAGGKDVFLHARSLPPGTAIGEGDRVSFTIETEQSGKLRAASVRLV